MERYVNRLDQGIEGLAVSRGMSENRAKKYGILYRDAKKFGAFTLKGMDLLCCDVLWVHPLVVYGDLYWSIEMDTRAMKPCQRCQGPKTLGNKRLCDPCKEADQVCACGCGEKKNPKNRTRYIPGHKPENAPGRRIQNPVPA